MDTELLAATITGCIDKELTDRSMWDGIDGNVQNECLEDLERGIRVVLDAHEDKGSLHTYLDKKANVMLYFNDHAICAVPREGE